MKKNDWDRLDDESQKAYDAFLAYLHMGKARSIAKAYASRNPEHPAPQKGSRSWKRWSKKYRWTERTASYDNHINASIVQQCQAEFVAESLGELEEYRRVQRQQSNLIANLNTVFLRAIKDISQGKIDRPHFAQGKEGKTRYLAVRMLLKPELRPVIRCFNQITKNVVVGSGLIHEQVGVQELLEHYLHQEQVN